MSNPTEPSVRESVDIMFSRAVALMDLPPGLEQKRRVCTEIYTVRFGVRLRGQLQTFTGYRSVHSEHMEPVKGGIRFAMGVNQDEVEALAALMRHSWPGNVRELENLVERTAVLSTGDEIRLEELPAELCSAAGGLLARAAREEISLEELEEEYIRMVLDRTGGNQTRTAEILGIDRRTLYRKLRNYEGEEG